jgi:hypothetical protein
MDVIWVNNRNFFSFSAKIFYKWQHWPPGHPEDDSQVKDDRNEGQPAENSRADVDLESILRNHFGHNGQNLQWSNMSL